MIDIARIAGTIAALKPISQVIHKVMALVEDKECDLEKLSEVISCDPTLTANLLKKANSAYYGLSGRFQTVHQAVVFLGSAEVVNLVMMSCMNDKLKNAQKGYDLEDGQLWHYSLSSAILAKNVAAMKNITARQVVFTASVLKDIGKVILSQFVLEQFQQIRSLVTMQGHSFMEAEKAVLGIDHAQLGALVARAWNFSPTIIDIIENHHRPLESALAVKETAAVYMGDLLCMMLGIGVGADGLAYRFQPAVVNTLEITEKEIQQILMQFGAEMDRMQALLSV